MIEFNIRAFKPLFDFSVAYEAVRGTVTYRGTFNVSDMGEDFADPLAAVDAATQVRTRTFIVESTGAGGWNLETFPQIGDRFTTDRSVKYAVIDVTDFAGSFALKCKEVK